MVDIAPKRSLTTRPDRRLLSQITKDPKLIIYLENLGLDVSDGADNNFATLLLLINDAAESAYSAQSSANELSRLVEELRQTSGHSPLDTKSLERKLWEIEQQLVDMGRQPIPPAPTPAFSPSIITVTAAYNVPSASPYQPATVRANAATAGFTVNLPSSPAILQLVNVKKIDATANVVTINGGAINIDGGTTVAIGSQYTNMQVQFNGASWDVL